MGLYSIKSNPMKRNRFDTSYRMQGRIESTAYTLLRPDASGPAETKTPEMRSPCFMICASLRDAHRNLKKCFVRGLSATGCDCPGCQIRLKACLAYPYCLANVTQFVGHGPRSRSASRRRKVFDVKKFSIIANNRTHDFLGIRAAVREGAGDEAIVGSAYVECISPSPLEHMKNVCREPLRRISLLLGP